MVSKGNKLVYILFCKCDNVVVLFQIILVNIGLVGGTIYNSMMMLDVGNWSVSVNIMPTCKWILSHVCYFIIWNNIQGAPVKVWNTCFILPCEDSPLKLHVFPRGCKEYIQYNRCRHDLWYGNWTLDVQKLMTPEDYLRSKLFS